MTVESSSKVPAVTDKIPQAAAEKAEMRRRSNGDFQTGHGQEEKGRG